MLNWTKDYPGCPVPGCDGKAKGRWDRVICDTCGFPGKRCEDDPGLTKEQWKALLREPADKEPQK